MADGVFVPDRMAVGSTRGASAAQKAIVIREGADEVLLLQTSYQGPRSRFAWLVPVPAVPSEVFEAEPAFLASVFASTAPVVHTRSARPHAPGLVAGAAKSAATGSDSAEEAVTVHARIEVGGYDATVLSASGGAPLLAWLGEHGYGLDGALQETLDDYASRGFAFVALRFLDALTEGDTTAFDVDPIGIRFPSETLWFPLTISRAGAPALTSLLLCVVDEQPVECATLPCVWLGERRVALPAGRTYGAVRREQTRAPGGGPALLCEYVGKEGIRYGDLSYRRELPTKGGHKGGGILGRTVTRFFGLLRPEEMTDLSFDRAPTRPSDYRVLIEREPRADAWTRHGLRWGGFAMLALAALWLVSLRKGRGGGPRGALALLTLVAMGSAALAGGGDAGSPIDTLLGALDSAARSYRDHNGCYPATLDDLYAQAAPSHGLDESGNTVEREGAWQPAPPASAATEEAGRAGLIYDPLNIRLVDSGAYSVRVSGQTEFGINRIRWGWRRARAIERASAGLRGSRHRETFWGNGATGTALFDACVSWRQRLEPTMPVTRVLSGGGQPSVVACAGGGWSDGVLASPLADVCAATREVAVAVWVGVPRSEEGGRTELYVIGAGGKARRLSWNGPATGGRALRISRSGRYVALDLGSPYGGQAVSIRVVETATGATVAELPAVRLLDFCEDERALFVTQGSLLARARWDDGRIEAYEGLSGAAPPIETPGGLIAATQGGEVVLANGAEHKALLTEEDLHTCGRPLVLSLFGETVVVVAGHRPRGGKWEGGVVAVPLSGAPARVLGACECSSDKPTAILAYHAGGVTLGTGTTPSDWRVSTTKAGDATAR